MTEDERRNLLEQRDRGQSWLDFKAAGAHLLQHNRITPEEYHNAVRSYGIESGTIDPNNPNIPEKIDDDEGKKLGLEIGGAVLGSIIFGGARLAHPLGWIGYAAQQSLASGAGAAAGNYLYHKTMDSPQYASEKHVEDAMEVGKEVTKFNAAFMGGLKVGGPLIKQAGLLGLGTVKGGVKLGAQTLNLATGGILSKGYKSFSDKASKYILGKSEMADAILRTAQERGVVLSHSMLMSPTIRSILEAFSRAPVVGTPIRDSYDRTIKSVADSLIKDVKQGATLEQAASKFSNRFKFDEKTGRYLLDDAGGYSPDTINFEAIVNVLNRADGYEAQLSKSWDDLFGIYDKVGRPRNSANLGALGKYAPNVTWGSMKMWWSGSPGSVKSLGLEGHFDKPFRKLMNKIEQGKPLTAFETKQLYKGMDSTEKHLLNQLQSKNADDLYINFDDARVAFNRDVGKALGRSSREEKKKVFNMLNLHNKTRKEQISFIQKADQTGMMSATNIIFREGGEMAERLNTAMRNSFLVTAKGRNYSDMIKNAQGGDFFVIPGSTAEAAMRASGKYGDQGYETIMRELFIKGTQKQHDNLLELVGSKTYGKLAQNELDNIFDSTLIKYLNDGGGPGRADFLKAIGATGSASEARIAKDRIELLLTNLNKMRKGQTVMFEGKEVPLKPITYKNLKDFGELLQFLPEKPNLNQFVQRSLALKMAGGINAGTVTGFVGIGGATAAAGPVGGVMAIGTFRILTELLSRPARYGDYARLLGNIKDPATRAKALEKYGEAVGMGEKIINGMFNRAITDGDTALIRGLVTVGAVTQKEANSMLRQIMDREKEK